MQKITVKLTACAFVLMLAQACMNEEIAPSKNSSAAEITSAQSTEKRIQNSFWATVRPYTLDYPIAELTFEGFEIGKTITINWGDGTVQDAIFIKGYNGRARLWVEHSYATMDNFTISVTGDLSNISAVISPLTTVEIFSINFDKLSQIEEVDMPYNSVVSVDLSKNRKLKRVSAPSSTLTQSIVLPNTHSIEYFSTGSPNMSTQVVSGLISSVYKNAVTKKIYSGFFGLDTEMSESPSFPGPPTEADMAKLRELRDVYGWTIYPNP